MKLIDPATSLLICLFDNCTTFCLLLHCATSHRVAVSIPDGVIGIFHRYNPSDRTKALGSTQPLTEISTRSIYWGVKAAGG
jgi:hypothetical protein